MKRLMMCFLYLCMVCGLIACGQNGESSMVKVINASAEEIYGIGCTYYVDGELFSSGGGCYADNSAIRAGDEFSLENQLLGEDTKKVELELSVVDKLGKEYPCASKILLDEMPCEIKVMGDFENGFDTFVKTN